VTWVCGRGVTALNMGTRDDLATNQVTAMRVGDGERIAALAVAGGEVAFEIHAPEVIRKLCVRVMRQTGLVLLGDRL
jgi:hypothetical protein